MEETEDLDDLDALVIGAGFGGVRMMLRLQMLGLKVKIFEQNETLGGLWYWHLYPGHPGVRPNKDFRNADSMYDEDMWKDWTWTQKFPGRGDICHRQYFGSVDRLRELSKDVYFNSKVINADWDDKAKKWVVKTENGVTARAQYLMACNGLFNKRYIPSIKGIDKFSGPCYHTAAWPREGVDLKGKRVAVIGTGASGLKCIEDIHRSVRQLTVYHGMPSLCLPTSLPTQQTERSLGKQPEKKEGQKRLDKSKLETFAGFSCSYVQRAAFSGDASMRLTFFEGLWRMGGFYFWLANYIDLLFDRQPNDPLYKFWCEKSREHMKDPALAKKPAPFDVPHTWETKRPSPVSTLPEVFKRKNVVDLIDVSENPVIEVTPNGIETRDTFTEFDVVVLATG
jgi:cation diffusion facilitator CzcD-associated flavoprotein CzcO